MGRNISMDIDMKTQTNFTCGAPTVEREETKRRQQELNIKRLHNKKLYDTFVLKKMNETLKKFNVSLERVIFLLMQESELLDLNKTMINETIYQIKEQYDKRLQKQYNKIKTSIAELWEKYVRISSISFQNKVETH